MWSFDAAVSCLDDSTAAFAGKIAREIKKITNDKGWDYFSYASDQHTGQWSFWWEESCSLIARERSYITGIDDNTHPFI